MISGDGPYHKPQNQEGERLRGDKAIYLLSDHMTFPYEASRKAKPYEQSSASSKLVKWSLSYPSINT